MFGTFDEMAIFHGGASVGIDAGIGPMNVRLQNRRLGKCKVGNVDCHDMVGFVVGVRHRHVVGFLLGALRDDVSCGMSMWVEMVS